MTQSKIAIAALLALLGATVWVYLPGLAGSFIFDDFHNLDALGHYGGVTSWESARAFVFSGISGPTGRPLALATFLLNDQYWPSQAMSFKYTNLMIHLLVGLGVCWATLNLLRVLGYSETEAAWIAVLSAGFWLLHPYFVSTTLYVIQRMTQLATLFSIYGIAAYLHGRKLIRGRPAAGYAWMLGGLTVGGVLAVLSKENGALLPVMILAIEACIPQDKPVPRYFRLWKAVFLWVPTLVILGYLATQIDFSVNPWPNRPFNQVERLLTQPVIVVEYLYDLFVPKFEGRGLFQDGFEISRGILQPPRTLVSIVALLILATLAFIGRRKYPLLALPLLFFLAGHLLESTVIGLELYFEHRNYLPAAYLFMPLAAGIVWLPKRFSVGLAVAVALVLFGYLSFMTWQRATLWSGGYRLISYWALKNPDSARAQNGLAQIMVETGRADEALELLQRSVTRLPDSANLTTSLLMLKVADGSAEEKDFAWAGERLAMQSFDAQAVKGIYGLVDFVTYRDARESYVAFTQKLLLRMAENERYMRFPLFQRFLPFQQGRLFLHQGHPEEAYEKFLVAMRLYGSIDSAMEMVVQMASYGYADYSLKLLDEAEKLLAAQENKSLIRSREAYQSDIARIRHELQEDLTSDRAR
ncbi:MAG: tetratricopeptide repeat protein [Dechloromonas sp.]|uniref:Tetratricopeptide repeat protein n=1 Tax=Candidatus Dechloromonas phosphorivorans TaxID=2899244 RepID=A0A9D7QJS5_9RHOO|nr:tetratricopeptide repeat protein [Candidatus Dechloromonas phosphorivorans]